ncbi:MAG TPA: hypothetical protein VMA31_09835 [Bryobacteraceae bacterium]|nr:hypothetical protein [Bryobacteraceae bacterium]
MKRPNPATVATVLVIAALLAVAIVRRQPKPPPTPKATIYAMLDAARAGNTSAYLAQYAGPLASQLQQSVTANYLKSSNAEIKGVSVSEPQFLSDREASLRLEYIYQDRNEAQTVYLEFSSGAWKIARVDSAERVPTLVPYGTPVQ